MCKDIDHFVGSSISSSGSASLINGTLLLSLSPPQIQAWSGDFRREGLGTKGGWRRPVDAHWPSNISPIGAKLCQNAFQAIPIVSSSGHRKKIWRKISATKSFSTFQPPSVTYLFWGPFNDCLLQEHFLEICIVFSSRARCLNLILAPNDS